MIVNKRSGQVNVEYARQLVAQLHRAWHKQLLGKEQGGERAATHKQLACVLNVGSTPNESRPPATNGCSGPTSAPSTVRTAAATRWATSVLAMANGAPRDIASVKGPS